MVPVQCLDGNQFTERLLTHEIGITRQNGEMRLDEAYFARLVADIAKSRRIVSLLKTARSTGKPGTTPLDEGGISSSVTPMILSQSTIPDREKTPDWKSRKPGDLPLGLQLSLHLWLVLPAQPEND